MGSETEMTQDQSQSRARSRGRMEVGIRTRPDWGQRGYKVEGELGVEGKTRSEGCPLTLEEYENTLEWMQELWEGVEVE